MKKNLENFIRPNMEVLQRKIFMQIQYLLQCFFNQINCLVIRQTNHLHKNFKNYRIL